MNPDTTYYFVIQTKTGAYSNNTNDIYSDYSSEISVTTQAGAAQQYTLTVQSSPDAGVSVTVSPADINSDAGGTTTFTREYTEGTGVTVTAPVEHNGQSFLKWLVDGADNAATAATVTMDGDHTLTAVYEEESTPGTYTLTVGSSPAGVEITVTPADNNGYGNGTAAFTRNYNEGAAVTVTAPAQHNGQSFLKWYVDGADNTNTAVTVTMNANHTLTAVYEEESTPETYTLTVGSSPTGGAAITVTPADNNGDSNGTTTFTRDYTEGTAVTLTAPAEYNGQSFLKWLVDGAADTNTIITVTMNADRNAAAYYGTASRPGLELSRETLNFGYISGETPPPSQALRITIDGTPVDWSTETDAAWLQLTPSSGTGTVQTSVSVSPEGLSAGKYTGSITVSAPDADNSPLSLNVVLNVYESNSTSGPVGDFSTPFDGSNVFSSVPVTGWAVDDMGVESVKIYREGRDQNDLVYIGAAVFVEGARPDIEELYPEYPRNHQAGWGYMLLTNFLPGGGNGTFTLHAIAADVEGNEVTLGTKTITVDNANAVKPFGAIDTPTQGGTASGGSFTNWGWALTPQPNSIPDDGSTINVYVDGVMLGHPSYNLYREDIAGYFPGYANSDGAIGYFSLDTTGYEDGVHTIQWTVTDSARNSDGIGSRYFVIDNSTGNPRRGTYEWEQGLGIRKKETTPTPLPHLTAAGASGPDDEGIINIEIKELERVVIRLGLPSQHRYAGYSSVGNKLKPLPPGSFLDVERGVFYWQPGFAFYGLYTFEFIARGAGGKMIRKRIDVNIIPRFN